MGDTGIEYESFVTQFQQEFQDLAHELQQSFGITGCTSEIHAHSDDRVTAVLAGTMGSAPAALNFSVSRTENGTACINMSICKQAPVEAASA